jgi:hypothetical protein
MTDRCPECGRDPELGYCNCQPDVDGEPVVDGEEAKAAIAAARAHLAKAKRRASGR